MSPVRWLAALRLAWAALLVARPRTVLTLALAPRERRSPRARTVVLVLGARNLIQAIVELVWPRPLVLAGGAIVDALHAISFLGFAAVRPDPRWRRAVLLNVITATMFSAATITARRQTPRNPLQLAEPPDGTTANEPLDARESSR
jgi:hypothetical protein